MPATVISWGAACRETGRRGEWGGRASRRADMPLGDRHTGTLVLRDQAAQQELRPPSHLPLVSPVASIESGAAPW